MRSATIKFFTVITIAFWMMSLIACDDDNGVGPELGEAPPVPLLQGVDIDDSYFQENDPDYESVDNPEVFQPYETARAMVVGMRAGVQAAIQLPTFFLLEISQRDPEFIDGAWVWDFPFTVSGELIDEEEDFTVDAMVIADVNENANEVDWDVYFSGDNTPFGEINNHLLITATTSLDNSAGSLQFISPENPGDPILDLEWDVDLPDSRFVGIMFLGEDEETEEPFVMSSSYLEEGDEFSLDISEMQGQPPLSIEWNTSTLEGSLTSPESFCSWGADLIAECNN